MINGMSSLLQSLGGSVGSGGGSDNQDLETQRKAIQRQSLIKSNKAFELSEEKKNIEALR